MKNGKRFTHRAWVYTGNSSHGHSIVHEDGHAALAAYLGLAAEEDGMHVHYLMDRLQSAIDRAGQHARITVGGFAVERLTVSRSQETSFGYEYTAVYRATKLDSPAPRRGR